MKFHTQSNAQLISPSARRPVRRQTDKTTDHKREYLRHPHIVQVETAVVLRQCVQRPVKVANVITTFEDNLPVRQCSDLSRSRSLHGSSASCDTAPALATASAPVPARDVTSLSACITRLDESCMRTPLHQCV